MIKLLLYFIILGGLGYFIYRVYPWNVKDSDKTVEDHVNDIAPKPDSLDDKYKNLISVTKDVTTSSTIKDQDQHELVTLIEDVWELLRPLNERYPTQDVTFRINRMATGHINELVDSYNGLKNPSKEDIEKFQKQLDNMRKGVMLAKDALEQDDQAKFDETATFLDSMHGRN